MRHTIFTSGIEVSVRADAHTGIDDPFVLLTMDEMEVFLSPTLAREIVSSLEIALREVNGDVPGDGENEAEEAVR